jgi:predicted Rossmann fold nucleotide-binding protein DprA/Smf involved in DNA uptake
MVEIADAVLVIWDGESKGALSTINFAKKCNKPVIVVNLKETEN